DIGADEFTLLPNDIGVAQIIHPKTGCELSDIDSIVVEILNFGSSSQTGFEVAFQLNQQTPVVETISEQLQPGQKIIYTFQQKVDLSTPASYSLKAYTR